jgi:cation diffusion facilitator family transporter
MSAEGSNRAILAAYAANLGIAVAKFIGFAITGASSMLAESIHSVADTGNQALLLVGGRRARRDADAEHPFGYGRERYFYGFVVALVLFTLGAVFAVYEGIHKLQHPEDLESPIVAILILLVAIGLEGFSLRTAVGEANHARGDDSWFAYIRHSKSPELPVVLLEDIGAMIGLGVAFVALLLTWAFDEPTFDAVGTLIIGALLGVIAAVLAVEMKSLLIGEAALPGEQQAIRDAISSGSDVRELVHLRTEHVGPDEILVVAKVAYRNDLSVPELTAAIDATEVRIRSAVPSARLIYIEPGLEASKLS